MKHKSFSRHLLLSRLFSTLIALFFGVGAARATFHEMQIEQVIGGVNGDNTAQAIQLRMRAPGQSFVQGAKLMAYDSTGANGVLLIQFPSDVNTAAAGSRILITSSSFSSKLAAPLTQDFTFTNPIPPAYLAAGRITYTSSAGDILWSLSFGGGNYTGSSAGSTVNDADGNFGPPFAGPLPSAAAQALDFQGTASSPSTSNSADYALTSGPATFTNNDGASAVVGPPPATLPKIVPGPTHLGLRTIADGLVSPVDLVSAHDSSGRLFLVEQTGAIRIIAGGQLLPSPFLDVAGRLAALQTDYDERGLLGLAFHPGFHDPASAGYRKFYTFTSEPVSGTADFTTPMTGAANCQSVIAEWQVSTADSNIADPSTRREILRIDKPQFNHNGGKLAFRPGDGYLYVSLGDGGNANDTGDGHGASGNAQNLHTALGKILRIDPLDPGLTTSPGADPVSTNGKYRIAAANPFAPDPACAKSSLMDCATPSGSLSIPRPVRIGFSPATSGRIMWRRWT